MKTRNLLFIFFLFVLTATAQTKWYNPVEAPFPVIQNQGWSAEIGKSYHRLPDRAKEVVRKPVWDLSTQSAGLALHFYTNAEEITVRYGVTGAIAMPHMPATGKSGVDLYAIDPDGVSHVNTGSYSFADTVTYRYRSLCKSNYHALGLEYHLYLPLYNEVKWMEIGVPDSARFSFIPPLKERPIIVYGTSIAQGGCASRPAMGWSNILSRKLDLPVINLAYSGNGPLEKEMVDLICEQAPEAALIVYDCLPNMTGLPIEEIKRRTAYGITAIRQKSDLPILVVDHPGNRNYASLRSADGINKASREAFDSLQLCGVKNLYYLPQDSLRIPQDGCVDNVHPNDLGMQAYADAYEKIIRRILSMPAGTLATTQPVSQRREPYIYEWKSRHRNKLTAIREHALRKVIIGNSIIHYWNDEPGRENGAQSWKKYMESNGYLNLGCGWDRIENVLWRIYHGELEGYDAEEIIIMIGTNNVGLSSDDEIVYGLEFLLRQIRIRQPKAKIKVIGILPRRATEERIKQLNLRISTMAQQNGYDYRDVGGVLLKKGGEVIDESCFSDGLHPNDKGYSRIAPLLIQ